MSPSSAATATPSNFCNASTGRVYEGLSPRYFGNAVRNVTLRLPREEVLDVPLGRLAERVRQATTAMNAQGARESLRCLAAVRLARGLDAFARMHAVDPGSGFLVTNLSKTPLDALDCGFGPPEELIPLDARTAVGVRAGRARRRGRTASGESAQAERAVSSAFGALNHRGIVSRRCELIASMVGPESTSPRK